MTREQYLMMRQGGNFNIVYEFYKENFDQSKHKPFLGIQELAQLLPMFGNIDVIFETCCKHYDQKFNVVRVSDKNGNLIKLV
jgi:hypothetical protein